MHSMRINPGQCLHKVAMTITMTSKSSKQKHMCDWIYKKGSYTHNYKYLETRFEIFNSIYLENDWSCLQHVFLHKSLAIQSNSLYLLYTGQLTGFPAILDGFSTDVANTTVIYCLHMLHRHQCGACECTVCNGYKMLLPCALPSN